MQGQQPLKMGGRRSPYRSIKQTAQTHRPAVCVSARRTHVAAPDLPCITFSHTILSQNENDASTPPNLRSPITRPARPSPSHLTRFSHPPHPNRRRNGATIIERESCQRAAAESPTTTILSAKCTWPFWIHAAWSPAATPADVHHRRTAT